MAIKRLTEQDDKFTLSSKSYTQIDALGGNDTITIATGSANRVVINAGAGNDTVTLNAGSKHEVRLTSGNNMVYVNTGIEHVIKGGIENDVVIFKNDSAIKGFNEIGAADANGLTSLEPSTPTVALSKGNDTVTLNGGRKHLIYTDDGMNATVAKGAGDDLVYVYGGQYNIVQMAGGKDTLKIYSKNDVERDIKGNTFATGADSDTIVIGTATAGTEDNGVFANRIQAGSEDDNITLTNGAMSNFIWGDAGDDTINIKGGFANKIFGDNKPTSTLADGAGNDRVIITGGKSNYVHTADGEDTITLSGSAEVTSNKVHGGLGADLITVTGGQRNFFYGDEDKDALVINGGTGNYFFGGADQDTITVNQANGNVIFGDKGYADNAEDAADTITVNGGWNNKLYGNGGNDKLSATDGEKLVIFGGSGSDSITLKECLASKVYTGNSEDCSAASTDKNTVSLLGSCQECYVYGTNQKDIINIISDGDTGYNKVYSGGGADEIGISSSNKNIVDSGAGNDTITIQQCGYNDIDTKAGNDTVTIEDAFNNVIYTRDGADWIYVNSGSSNLLVTGSGADNINIRSEATKTRAYTEGGADIIYLMNTTEAEVHAGEDADKLFVNGNTKCKVYADAGNDTISISPADEYGYTRSSTIDGGAGNDTITFRNLMSCSIVGGDGDDIIKQNIDASTNSEDLQINDAHATKTLIVGGDGKDIIDVYALNSIYIDTVTFESQLGRDNVNVRLCSTNGYNQAVGSFKYEAKFFYDSTHDILGIGKTSASTTPYMYVQGTAGLRMQIAGNTTNTLTMAAILDFVAKGKNHVLALEDGSTKIYLDFDFQYSDSNGNWYDFSSVRATFGSKV